MRLTRSGHLIFTFADVKDTSWYCDDITPVLNRVDANGQQAVSARDRRQGRANALREIEGTIGRLRDLIN